MSRLAGLEHRDQVKGKTDFDLIWKKRAHLYVEIDQQVISSGRPILNHEEVIKISNQKSITAITNKVPLFGKNGVVVGLLGTTTDITHQKQIENDLSFAKQKAEAANHAKTEFIANMSHDIRTPLAGVIGLANILESQVTEPIQKKEAHDLGQSGNELLNMLNEILDVVAADHVNTNDIHEGPFHLSDLVRGIINLEQPYVTVKNIHLMTSIDPNIPPVLFSDYKKIHHILLNLVGNAIKFTTAGQVQITVNLLEKQAEIVMLQFQVTDTGKGIPVEALAHVFDPFFRVTPSYKGLDKGHGLGLHIAQTYVQLLGGIIEVSSKLNEGSVFSFNLAIKIGDQRSVLTSIPIEITPLPVLDAVQSSASCPMTQDEAGNTAPSVLIIEDNPIALIVAETLIKNSHLATSTAIDGESALALAKIHSFDLILSDVGLPGISGIELTRLLRAYEIEQQKTPTPIIGLTAHVEGKTRDECIEAGMNDVMIKPLTSEMVKKMMTQFSLNKPHAAKPPPNNATKLGPDLPDMETELFALSKFSLLDAELAIKELGNNKTLLITMLTCFLEQLPQERQAIQAAYESKNWEGVEKLSHKMKGGAVYLKLNQLSVACQYLERYHKAGHTKLLEPLYQQMVNVMENTTPAVIAWLQKNQ